MIINLKNDVNDRINGIFVLQTPDSVLSGETTTSRRVKRSDIIGFIRQICPPLANVSTLFFVSRR